MQIINDSMVINAINSLNHTDMRVFIVLVVPSVMQRVARVVQVDIRLLTAYKSLRTSELRSEITENGLDVFNLADGCCVVFARWSCSISARTIRRLCCVVVLAYFARR